jgi:HSP20 family molecular chaperone IbpA
VDGRLLSQRDAAAWRRRRKVRASFRNGMLEIHLPKAKEARAKKIDIKVE